MLFGVAGIFFGLMVGWIIGSQQAPPARTVTAQPTQAAAAAATPVSVPLDESRAAELEAAADRDPRDAESRLQLGNMYFDAERFQEAARWYENALAIDPRNADASTDLGIAYYYMNQPDRALSQFEHALVADPGHTKALLNTGIVRAFGKQDLEGAARAWQRVVEMAPDTPEGRAARQALDGLRSAHPDLTGGAAPAKGSGEPE